MRVIFDLPVDIQMAIRLRAVKTDKTNGEVIAEAVERVFPDDLADAKAALAANQGR